ncbi:MAG TPA: hypothetical protein VOA41_16355 [Candidatus Dormibacteraeota bacterium]|nr:hypothetical protein [Candidatus Dormibacteraeota bacterium]
MRFIRWGLRLRTGTRILCKNVTTQITGGTLRVQELDCDLAQGCIGFVASDMGEGAARKMYLGIGKLQADFGLAENGVSDVGRADEDVKIVEVVPVEKGRFMRGDGDVENADVGVFEDQIMTALAR